VGFSRRIVPLLLVALLIALAPAAGASPPDPTWLGGYWDDADFDGAVISIASACAIPAAPVPDAAPNWACFARLELREFVFAPAPCCSAGSPRAPPLV